MATSVRHRFPSKGSRNSCTSLAGAKFSSSNPTTWYDSPRNDCKHPFHPPKHKKTHPSDQFIDQEKKRHTSTLFLGGNFF